MGRSSGSSGRAPDVGSLRDSCTAPPRKVIQLGDVSQVCWACAGLGEEMSLTQPLSSKDERPASRCYRSGLSAEGFPCVRVRWP